MSHAVNEHLWVGETYRCDATNMVTGMTYNKSWSTNGGYFSLSGSGLYCDVTVTKYFSGQATVTLKWQERIGSTYMDRSTSWTFTCQGNAVSITPSSMELAVGESKNITYSHQYSNSYTSSANVTYSSSNSTIASVSSTGVVTAKKAGSCYITVYSSLSSVSPYCNVTVTGSNSDDNSSDNGGTTGTTTGETIRTIEVKEAGTLGTYISNTDKYKITELTISGRLNGTDLRLLRDMAGYDGGNTNGKLEKLDLREAVFVSGGRYYNSRHDTNYYTSSYSSELPAESFAYCSSIKYLYLPKYLTGFEWWSTMWMKNLTHIEIPANVSSIPDGELNCSKITKLSIPSSVSEIGSDFYQCYNLSTIYCYASEPPVMKTGFNSTNIENGILYVPKGCSDKYWRAKGWCDFGNIVEMSDVYYAVMIYPRTVGGSIQYEGRTTRKRYADHYLDGNCGFDIKGGSDISLKIVPDKGYQIDKINIAGEDGISWDVTGELNNGIIILKDLSEAKFVNVYFKESADGESSDNENTNVDEVSIGNIKYKITNEKAILIDGVSATGNVVIPSTISYNEKRYTVTGIDKYAFYQNAKLDRITIPGSITKIDSCAFYGCVNLSIVNIEEGVNSIYRHAFGCCKSIQDISIPSSVIYIDPLVFGSSRQLTDINIDANNKFYCSKDGVLYTKDLKMLHTYPEGKQGTRFVIPNEVTHIGASAFYGCNLTDIVIPNTVTHIGSDAFGSCEFVENIVIPENVISIGQNLFGYSGLQSITVASGNTVYDSRNECNAIIETATNTLIAGCRKTTIPYGVKIIEAWALYNSSPSKITIPSSVTEIKQFAFSYVGEVRCFWKNLGHISISSAAIVWSSGAKLFVPVGTKDSYQATKPWSDFVIEESDEEEQLPDDFDETDYILGDANGDGSVSVTDITSIGGYLMDHNKPINKEAADANQDGNISVTDITQIGKMLFSNAAKTLKRANALQADDGVNIILDNGKAEPGSEITLPVNMTGCASAFQFDVYTPQGISIKKVQRGSLLKAMDDNDEYIFTFRAEPIDGGAFYRVVAYNTTDTPTSEAGEVVKLLLEIDANMPAGEYNIQLKETECGQSGVVLSTYKETSAKLTVCKETNDGVNIVLADGKATAGSEVTLPVNITGKASGFQFDVYLPKGISIKKVQRGSLLKTMDDNDEYIFTFRAEPIDGGAFYRVVAYNTTDTPTSEAGEVVKLVLDVDAGLSAGDYEIVLKETECGLSGVVLSTYKEYTAKLTVENTSGISDITSSGSNGETRVYNAAGVMIKQIGCNDSNMPTILDGLANGIYIIKSNGVTRKVVKE